MVHYEESRTQNTDDIKNGGDRTENWFMRSFAVSYYLIAKYNSASSGTEIGERHSFVKIDKICRPFAYISVLVRNSFEESLICVT